MTCLVFLTAPLDDADWCREVLGVERSLRADVPGYGLEGAEKSLPGIWQSERAMVSGCLVSVTPAMLERLTALYATFGAFPAEIEVQATGGCMSATAFMNTSTGSAQAAPDRDRAIILRRASAEMLALAATHGPDALRTRWPMALSHAASVARAKAAANPAKLRAAWGRADVKPQARKIPYAWFFGVVEEELQFRRFDGALSPAVKRAGFVMSDAVTVLPYDPERDCVLLIEQFRYAPWLRGAENCWSLEPIAGRVDPFERPEDCALREAREEADLGLARDGLIAVGNVYPSPGAVTEFLYHYVALCALPEGTETVAGLESEAEDIRSHVISFDELMSLIASGEVQNGPLVLTAYWLAAHREGLRSTARS